MLGSVFSPDGNLAIDWGTGNTVIFAEGRGVVVDEASVVAFNDVTGELEAAGNAAKAMLGRTPATIRAERPMKHGVITDFDAAEIMLGHFVRRAWQNGRRLRPRVLVGVPRDMTLLERRAIRNTLQRAGAAHVHLVDEALAAAIGSGMQITEPVGHLVVDVGSGTTDVALISAGGVVDWKSIPVASDTFDAAIIRHMRNVHDLAIGERTAEQMKIRIGCEEPLHAEADPIMVVKGHDLALGRPSTVLVRHGEIRAALHEPIGAIVQAIRDTLDESSPELCADVLRHGVVLTGGGALLPGLQKRVAEGTGLPVRMADDPLYSIVRGEGRLLADQSLLRQVERGT